MKERDDLEAMYEAMDPTRDGAPDAMQIAEMNDKIDADLADEKRRNARTRARVLLLNLELSQLTKQLQFELIEEFWPLNAVNL